jgi:hypothetical protein
VVRPALASGTSGAESDGQAHKEGVAEYSVEEHSDRERSRTHRGERKDAVVHEKEHGDAEERSEEPGLGVKSRYQAAGLART